MLLANDFTEDYLYTYALGAQYHPISIPAINHRKLKLFLRRDDLLSSHYPGNKFYKLFFNIQSALNQGCEALVSFGGAYSNHIHALAAVGKQYQIATVGMIRGHRPKVLSPTLKDAQALGMRLLFLDKTHYRDKDISPWLNTLKQDYGSLFIIPEGGANIEGVKGCRVLGKAISSLKPSTVCCAVGTGTTLAGIIAGLDYGIECLGFSVLKGDDSLTHDVASWLGQLSCDHSNWRIVNDYHHGGYAKVPTELMAFMQEIEVANDVLLEPVYIAKVLWGVRELALQNYWPEGSRIDIVHGGGLQGRRGFNLSY